MISQQSVDGEKAAAYRPCLLKRLLGKSGAGRRETTDSTILRADGIAIERERQPHQHATERTPFRLKTERLRLSRWPLFRGLQATGEQKQPLTHVR